MSAMAKKTAAGSANSITEGVIWKQLLQFFFPILLGTFFQQLYNTVDAIIVGNFVGKEALAAVGGSTGTLINLLIGFFVGLSSGGSVIISQFFGANKGEETSRAVHTLIMLGLIASALFMAAGLLFSRQALQLIAVPDDIMDYALVYMRIYFAGVAFPILYNIGSAIMRAVGDSKRPLYFLIVCCLTNVVLDLVLVMGLKMGVAGAALATVLSQVVSVLLTFFSLMKTDECYKVAFRKLRLDMVLLRSMLRIGLPVGLQSTLFNISNLLIQSSINSFGTDIIAAWTAFGKVDSFFWMAISAFGVAVTTFVGQNFGAGKYDRVHKCVRVGIGMAMGMTILISAVILLIRNPALGLFTSDANVVNYGSRMIVYMVTFYFAYVPIEILSGAVKGAGDSFIPMIITLLGICVLRFSWVLILLPAHHDLFTLMVSYPISWFVTSIIFIIYYLKGGWMQRCIKRQG